MVLPRSLWLRAFWFEGLGYFRTQDHCLPLFYKTSILFSIKLLFSFLLFSIQVRVYKGWKEVVDMGMNETQLACGKMTVSRKQLHFGGKQKKNLNLQRQVFPCILPSFHLFPFMRNDRTFTKHKAFWIHKNSLSSYPRVFIYYYC